MAVSSSVLRAGRPLPPGKFLVFTYLTEARGSVVVKAVCYESEGRGFED
jgi:hypothetical protein